MNEQDFLKEAASIFPYLQEMRRGFHHHPELGDHEKWTSERIAQELTSMGIEVSRPVGTAVVGLLQGALFGGKLEREDGFILSILINFYINNTNYNYS